MERIQKIIANSGYCSRRKAEEYIKQHKVYLNNELVTELGTKANYNDEIVVDGKPITNKEDKEYYLLYKPEGVISTAHDEQGRDTVVSLIDTTSRIYPIGRLDCNTTGALVLTNDGELANKLMHPSSLIEKRYYARVNGVFSPQAFMKLKKGIDIEGRKVVPTYVKIKHLNEKGDTTSIVIGIVEGRNHIVKKMMESLGHTVIHLKRESYAFLDLEGLKPGEYRKLTIKEVKKLYAL